MYPKFKVIGFEKGMTKMRVTMNEKEFSQHYGRRVQFVSCLNFENRVHNETEEGREEGRKRGRETSVSSMMV